MGTKFDRTRCPDDAEKVGHQTRVSPGSAALKWLRGHAFTFGPPIETTKTKHNAL